MALFSRRWLVACIALLLLGGYAPSVSGLRSQCIPCADPCQQAEAGKGHESGKPADRSHHDGCGDGCDQCLICHVSSAQLPPVSISLRVEWTQSRVEFVEWTGAFYGAPLAEIDHPPQLS